MSEVAIPPDRPDDLAQASLELEERIRALIALRRIEVARNDSASLPEILQVVCDTVLEETDAGACGLLLRNPGSGELFLKAAGAPDVPLSYHRVPGASPYRRPADTGVPGWVLSDGQAVHIPDVTQSAVDLPQSLVPGGAGSLLCLPLTIDDTVAGILTVSRPCPDAFDAGDEVLLVAICERLGGILSDLRVFEDAQEVDAALREEVGRATTEERRLNEALREEIVARRRVEAELRQREKELEAQTVTLQELLAHLPEGVFLLDEEGTVVVANGLARDCLQSLTTAAAVGDRVTHLGDRTIDELLEPSETGPGHELLVEGPPRRIFEITARPIAQGVMRGNRVLVVQDVTHERSVQERIHQQDRLAAVGQLAAGIAHDFNNVLTSVIGYAELLRARDDIPADALQDLAQVSLQGERAAQMVRQILDFSRRTVAQRHPVGMKTFLKESMKVLDRTLPETIQTAMYVAIDECLVDADPTQLQQVLTNLVVNARDAMPDGGTLSVHLESLSVDPARGATDLSPGEWVVWTVADTGKGIAPSVRAHIFEPFFTTKGHGEGTGLGLAQVYGILEEHGGRIEVDSQVGAGTAFRIYLPRLLDEAEASPPQEAQVHTGEGETILVVEDQGAVRDLCRAMLEALGYRVLTAQNGVRALEVYTAQRDQLDLVLTDAVMPEMGGVALIDTLRQIDPHVPVLLMTGYPLGDRQGGNVPSGPVPMINKPLSLGRLGMAVREALRSQPPNDDESG